MAELPAVNRAVIDTLLSFIRTKLLPPQVVEKTKMNAENLATIFGPCILSFNHTDVSTYSPLPQEEGLTVRAWVRSWAGKTNVQELLAEMKLQKDFAMLLMSVEDSSISPITGGRANHPPPPPPAPPPVMLHLSSDRGEGDTEHVKRRPRNQNQVSAGERALWLSENAREMSRQRWAAKEREEGEASGPTNVAANTSPTSAGGSSSSGRGVVFVGEEARKRKEQEEERRMKTKNFVVKSSAVNNS